MYLTQKKIGLLFSSILLFSISSLHSDWNPEYCFPDEDITVLDDFIFKNLKEDMVSCLKNSWCSKEKIHLLMDLICITKPEVCVEIGAFTGSSVLPAATTLKYLQHGTMIAIDAWSNEEAIKNMADDDPNRTWWSQVYMDGAYQMFLKNLSQNGLVPFCRILRAPSHLAAPLVHEIDFLNLDGDYTETGSLLDVELFLPKVKSGGYILLSNLFIMVKGKAPKMKSFSKLFDACEMIYEIDHNNTVLFRKY